jgi:alanine racemase
VTAERWAWAEVDLAAVRHNVRWLRSLAAPAELWAVVKANGYGHGAVPVSRVALEAGASGLCVALVEEGVELRRAGIDAPVLVLSEPPAELMPAVASHDLRPILYTGGGIKAAGRAAQCAGCRMAVHLKIDTGMHRVGAHPDEAVGLAKQVAAHPSLTLEGVATHLAKADEPDDPATALQLARFDEVLAELARHGFHPPLVHAANSAGAIAHPRARRSLVRTGISVYGLAPSPGMAGATSELRPALSLKTRVSHLKWVAAGDRVSYGWRHEFERPTIVATLPLGYADGVPRRLFDVGGDVLLGARRRPIVGVVTMDQLMIDCGDDAVVRVGDEAVLLGRQSEEQICADEWAAKLGTINYEIVCGISARVPRHHLDPSA